MCQIPRETSKYESVWSYKEFNKQSDAVELEGCEKTLAWSSHKGPDVMAACLKKLEYKKDLWAMTERFPEFNSWREARNLKVNNKTSFY